jgi:hypothetical protein
LLLPALGVLAPGVLRADEAASIPELWEEAGRGGHFQPPPSHDLRRAEGLFRRSLGNNEGCETLRPAWAELGFELLQRRQGSDQLWVLRESPDRREGRGFYVLRRGSASGLALQAVHSFYDLHTRVITWELFAASDANAAAFNTQHRNVIDLAHVDDSYMNAFTSALVRLRPNALVVQLHGFARQKRTTGNAATADIILSNGTTRPSRGFRLAARSFERGFLHGSTLTYPYDTPELGGTTNRQGEIVRAAGHDGFMHVELSASLRRRLCDEASVRSDLLKNLQDCHRIFSQN